MERKSKSGKNSAHKRVSTQNPKTKTQNRKVSEARLAAFEILLKVEKERSFSSVLLPFYEEKLKANDRGLCHELALGVLRKRLYLDQIIQKFIKPKIEKLDLEVLTALRLGAYQLLFLDKIPVFAAINESVNLVHLSKKSSASGMVNAVLRKIEREKDFKFEYRDEIERVSAETSHPRWLIEHWTNTFGFKEAAELALANNETPRLVFRLTNKSDEKTIEILKKLGLELEESQIVSGAWRVLTNNELLHTYASAGKVYFQEESSQLVAHAVDIQKGERLFDVCAAPGSKTTLLSRQKAKGEGQNEASHLIFAGDKYFHRLRVLRDNCERTGADDVQIVAYDAEAELPFADETFDRILVDAPCSGTGTNRHNPEIRYFLNPGDFAELFSKQLGILKNASKVLKKGGRLIYSTCSLEPAENEIVVGKFLAENPDFKKITPKLPQQFLTADDYARTFPQRDKTDGFFIAILEKL